MRVKKNDRVEITGVMRDDPDPIPVGTKGVVDFILNEGTEMEQIVVNWENGRGLMLLPRDPFRVL